jgi:ribosomal protein S13
MKADNLMKKFVSDESRKALTSDSGGLLVVISRHPYDIAGSDTDRNWTNCMTMGHESSQRVQKLKKEYEDLIKNNSDTEDILRKQNYEKLSRGEDIDFDGMKKKFDDAMAVSKKIESLKKEIGDRKEMGQNVKYIIQDVKEGSLVSYLIKKNDIGIKNPISVLNIKPYSNEKDYNDIILISDGQMYGQGRPEFKKTVDNILSEINGVGKEGFYCLNKKLYADSPERVVVFNDDYFSKIADVVKKYYIENINKVSNDLFNFELGQMEDFFSSELSQILDDEEKIDKYMITFTNKVDVKEKEMVDGFKKCFLNEINNNDFFSQDFIYNQIKNFTGEKIVIDDVIDSLYDSIFYELCDSDCYLEYYNEPMGYIQSEILYDIEGI